LNVAKGTNLFLKVLVTFPATDSGIAYSYGVRNRPVAQGLVACQQNGCKLTGFGLF
jgi:hypothetical protein